MKKILVFALLVTGMVTSAQNRLESKSENKERLTVEQQTELRVKKMTLDLDLNAKQQKEVTALYLEEAKNREAKKQLFLEKLNKGEKLSADEKFEMRNQQLESQIEFKKKLKAILTDKQLEKWENKKEKAKVQTIEKIEKRKKEIKEE